MNKSSISSAMAPVLMTVFTTVAHAENSTSGWFFSFSSEAASNSVSDSYRLSVSKNLYGRYVDNDAIRTALPSALQFGIQESGCLSARLGYRKLGGRPGVRGFSYSWSAYTNASYCNARIHFDARQVKQIARNVVRETVYNGAIGAMQDIRYNYGAYLASTDLTITDDNIDDAATFTTDYLMDTSAPLPSNTDIATAFSTITPVVPPDYSGVATIAQDYTTTILDYAYEARDTLAMIDSVPDTIATSGKIVTLSFGTSLDMKYRATQSFNIFGGIDARAIAKASLVPSPMTNIYDDHIPVGFIGVEVDAKIGAEIQDFIGNVNLWASYTHPVFRQYKVPKIEGIDISSSDTPYYSMGVTFENGSGVFLETPADRSVANDNTKIGVHHQFRNGLKIQAHVNPNGQSGGLNLSMSLK